MWFCCDETPLFSDREGNFLKKSAIIETINRAGFLIGTRLKSHNNADSFGGHSLRRGGIAFLAAFGVARENIKILARHSSNAVDKYLETSTHVLAQLSSDTAIKVARFAAKDKQFFKEITCEKAVIETDDEEDAPKLPPAESESCGRDREAVPMSPAPNEARAHDFAFILRRGAKAHFINPTFPTLALCGWQFAKCPSATTAETAEPLEVFGRVQMCLKCVRAQHDADSDSDCRSDSSSSSSES